VIAPDRWRGVRITRVNHVWNADITSLRLPSGGVDLVAVLDGCSRYALSWAVAITMAVACGVEALNQALRHGQPEVFTTGHGAQCTRRACTARLQTGGVRISREGRGRALDHVVVERLWRRVKSEAVAWRDDPRLSDARQGLDHDVAFDNEARRHQALGDRPPALVYRG
jgi:putative transposase